jgi:mannosyltransferase OCH1-like enzyme
VKTKTIFLYWDNKPKTKTPEYINLCRKTIFKNCGNNIQVLLINKNNLCDYLENIPENLFKLKEIAHIADYVRVALLVKYGGIWLDSDCILLKDMNPIFNLLKKYEYVGYGWKENQPSLGFMASVRNCKFLQDHLNIITEKINSSKTFNFNWSGLGYDSLWKIAPNYKDKMYLFSHHYFSPIHWENCIEDFLGKDFQKITKNCFGVMLFNKIFSQSLLLNSNSQDIMQGCNLLSHLFRVALQK